MRIVRDMSISFVAVPPDGGSLAADTPWMVTMTETGFGLIVLLQIATDPDFLGSGLGLADIYDSQNGGFQPGWDASSTFGGLFTSPTTASVLPNTPFTDGSSHHFYLLTNDEIGNDTADFTFTTSGGGGGGGETCTTADGNKLHLTYPLIRRTESRMTCSDVVDSSRMKRIYPFPRRTTKTINLK